MYLASSIKRLAVAASLTFITLASAQAASVCADGTNTRQGMLDHFSRVGSNQRMASLCNVSQAALKKEREENKQTMKPCLDELKMKEIEVDTALTAGEGDGQKTYDRMAESNTTKKAMCDSIVAEYANK